MHDCRITIFLNEVFGYALILIQKLPLANQCQPDGMIDHKIHQETCHHENRLQKRNVCNNIPSLVAQKNS